VASDSFIYKVKLYNRYTKINPKISLFTISHARKGPNPIFL
jgi:hypothetical protein